MRHSHLNPAGDGDFLKINVKCVSRYKSIELNYIKQTILFYKLLKIFLEKVLKFKEKVKKLIKI